MSTSPVLPGFHPDPSICRVGEDYFLVNSTFEYFPGVPVHRSRDLVEWEQIGNVLDRPEQLVTRAGIGGASGGIYAPTLRHHDGLFWMVTTNLHEITRGHLLVHAADPAGPWSDPVYVPGLVGIDPDLAWDEAGLCRLTWSDVVRGGISQAVIDPHTGAVLSEVREIWRGTGGAHAEGPHLIRRGCWWYLVVAEGGTGPGHMVTVARSQSPDGPFEPHPDNPILTHRSTGAAVQSTGHADLVERADGTWAIVFLGTRPRGSFPRWHTNGRETFLAGVEWRDDWPFVDEAAFDVHDTSRSFVDDFSGTTFHPRWIAPGVDPGSFTETAPDGAGLRLRRGRAVASRAAENLLAVRVECQTWAARVDAVGDVALSVRMDDSHQAIVERESGVVRARAVIGPVDQVLASAEIADDVTLEIQSVQPDVERGAPRGPDLLRLGYRAHGELHVLAEFDGRYLSTEVAGGFTGRVVGVEALADDVLVRRIEVEDLGWAGHA
ncbi:glycoside hydrolase family 43 protein [Microbacterium sp. YJN-G]|uniref:glycoside hydrolase family 43 protein n=1 Tax=Microbacterium sp. YJN-G TaxID=2763257 RepID=UPI00187821B3|nr:glycoside hydrolase family 43 protein [Microbacterium sp. YJN-G]